MAGVYVDTSALGRVLLGEADSPAVLGALEGFERRVASRLLRIELLRLGARVGRVEQADQLAAGIALVPLDETVLEEAERVTPTSVATLDAIHLVTALRLAEAGHADSVMTYDKQLSAGAKHHGLTVLEPS